MHLQNVVWNMASVLNGWYLLDLQRGSGAIRWHLTHDDPQKQKANDMWRGRRCLKRAYTYMCKWFINTCACGRHCLQHVDVFEHSSAEFWVQACVAKNWVLNFFSWRDHAAKERFEVIWVAGCGARCRKKCKPEAQDVVQKRSREGSCAISGSSGSHDSA